MGISAGLSRPGHTMFNSINGAGACILPSAQVGDRVLAVINIVTGANESSSFESTTSKAGQIQQNSASNLSGNQYWAFTIG
jgi:hypothetical protein